MGIIMAAVYGLVAILVLFGVLNAAEFGRLD